MGVVNHSVEQNSDGDAAYQRALKLGQEILPQVCCVLTYKYRNPSTGMCINLQSQEILPQACLGIRVQSGHMGIYHAGFDFINTEAPGKKVY